MALEYQERLQKKLNISLIILVVLMLLAELSLMPSTNIRVDLLLVIPALVLHGITFFMFTFNIKSISKADDKTSRK
ncbi:hypothetical protein [Cognaticolwellia aestuarii]|uniref:hypothetical protein n=1 Tax=Cognaticolwellia aestuarii TaxID=329993 RepID=UPI0011777B58|nr:hypothetical protein [Cognaticolwellia aestuarii]